MNPERFVKVFDVLDSGFRDWSFSAFGLIFVAIGVVIVFFPAALRAVGIPYLASNSPLRRWPHYFVLVFGVLWTVVSFASTYSEHSRHKSLVLGGGCRVVEGPVENFVPMPYAGHAVESFSVARIPFKYSDYMITDGFNNTSSHGGPINGDSYVRICYDPSDNVILRLEVRDFKGQLKDYGRIASPLSKEEDSPKAGSRGPAIRLPWYGYLVFPLSILDIIAIWMLFLPYLRTFLTIKTVSDWDQVLSRRLEAGVKIKLRNTMIYWDRAGEVIWLRPRGLILMQIPLMVARLTVDAAGKSILGYEIRFSSGFPCVLALMLWPAYESFSAIGAKGPPPAVLVFMGVLMVLASLLNLRIFRSRMEKLVLEAASELEGA